MATFAELRNEAKALGIDIHGKPARELEAEIAKKKAAPEAPKEEKKKMGRKAAAVEEKVEKVDGAGDVRIAALEEKVEAQAVIIRGCLAAMKAMAAEIGFELPKSLTKSAEVAEAVKEEEAEEAPAPKKRGRPAKAKEEPKAAPKKEEAEDDEDDEDEDEDEDEVVVDFSITEIEKADLARLQEIAAVINKAESSTVIEVIDNEKKLRKALLAWLKANAEVVVKDKAPEPVKDEKKASKKKETKKAAKDEDEDDDDEDDEDEADEEDDEDESEDECPEFCVKGAEIEIGFETDDDETEWCKAKVLKVHKTAADTLVLEGPNKGSEAEVPFDSMRAIKKKLKAGKK